MDYDLLFFLSIDGKSIINYHLSYIEDSNILCLLESLDLL